MVKQNSINNLVRVNGQVPIYVKNKTNSDRRNTPASRYCNFSRCMDLLFEIIIDECNLLSGTSIEHSY